MDIKLLQNEGAALEREEDDDVNDSDQTAHHCREQLTTEPIQTIHLVLKELFEHYTC